MPRGGQLLCPVCGNSDPDAWTLNQERGSYSCDQCFTESTAFQAVESEFNLALVSSRAVRRTTRVLPTEAQYPQSQFEVLQTLLRKQIEGLAEHLLMDDDQRKQFDFICRSLWFLYLSRLKEGLIDGTRSTVLPTNGAAEQSGRLSREYVATIKVPRSGKKGKERTITAERAARRNTIPWFTARRTVFNSGSLSSVKDKEQIRVRRPLFASKVFVAPLKVFSAFRVSSWRLESSEMLHSACRISLQHGIRCSMPSLATEDVAVLATEVANATDDLAFRQKHPPAVRLVACIVYSAVEVMGIATSFHDAQGEEMVENAGVQENPSLPLPRTAKFATSDVVESNQADMSVDKDQIKAFARYCRSTLFQNIISTQADAHELSSMLMHITDSTEEGTVSIGAKLSKSNTAVPNFLSELSLLEKIQLTETLSSTILPPVEVPNDSYDFLLAKACELLYDSCRTPADLNIQVERVRKAFTNFKSSVKAL